MTIQEKGLILCLLVMMFSALAVYVAIRAASLADRRDRELFHIETGKFHIETIKCPSCGRIQQARVEHTVPWWSYAHICDCGYSILESEWERVKNDEK